MSPFCLIFIQDVGGCVLQAQTSHRHIGIYRFYYLPIVWQLCALCMLYDSSWVYLTLQLKNRDDSALWAKFGSLRILWKPLGAAQMSSHVLECTEEQLLSMGIMRLLRLESGCIYQQTLTRMEGPCGMAEDLTLHSRNPGCEFTNWSSLSSDCKIEAIRPTYTSHCEERRWIWGQ